MEAVGVTLLGGGTVGGGVARVLAEQADLIARRSGIGFVLRHVVVRDTAKARPHIPQQIVHGDIERAISDPKVAIVVELIGGTTAAYSAVKNALNHGKSVVTANKSLLALYGPEIFALAKAKGVALGFEASCCGGIPVIGAITQGLVGNRHAALVGIVNGTCNFILTQMTRLGAPYETALAGAQKEGFAEADPTMDVSGRDSAQKLSLLASLAFDTRLSEADVALEGIDRLSAEEIKYAGDLGYVIKLLAIGEQFSSGQIGLRVHPTLVPKNDVLAEVGGSFNAISLYGSAVGHVLLYGRGAGSMPTASAVVADMVAAATGVGRAQLAALHLLGDDSRRPSLLPMNQLTSRYYLRLSARDEPGVLAQVTQVLGDERISIASFLQHGVAQDGSVPLVITTHLAQEGAVQRAVSRIDRLEPITAATVMLRIFDPPPEFG